MRNCFQTWNIILALIFLILFFVVVYPILSIFKASFINPETGAFSLKSYAAFFHYPYYLRCLRNSLFVSTLATLFALTLGIPFAFFLSRYHIPGKAIIKTLGTLPLILPTFIGAEAWLMLLGRNGLFTKLLQPLGLEIPSIYGWKGIVLVFTLQFFPFVFLMVSSAINAIDRSLEEAATNLGAGRLRVFFTVTLPVITPAILAGALVVFYLCIENFGVPVLIGEDFRVLSVQAYNEFISEMGGNPSMAGALSMILLAITLALTLFQKYWIERKSYTMTSAQSARGEAAQAACRLDGLAFLCRGCLRGPVPLCGRHRLLGNQEPGAGHVFRTMEPGEFHPGLHDRPPADLQLLLPGDDGHPHRDSVRPAGELPARPEAGRRELPARYPRHASLAIAGTVQGIALAATYNKGFIVLTGTWMILVLAYFIRKVPYSIKTTASLLQQIDPAIEEASINLGVSPVKSFVRVVMPVMLPGIIAGGIIMWVTTLAELSSTIVLYYGPWATMTVEVFQRIGSGSLGPASAYATILIISVLIPLFILNRVSGKDLASSL